MRFWQKAYLATLALFLLCLFGSVLGLGIMGQRQSFGAVATSIVARQQALAKGLATGLADSSTGQAWALPILYDAYGQEAATSSGHIELTGAEGVLYTTLPAYNGPRPELAVEAGSVNWILHEWEGRHYLYASSNLYVDEKPLLFTYAQDISATVSGWKRTTATYAGISAGVSLLLGVALYFVLRRLSRPFERLATTADKLAEGEYGIRAAETGSEEVDSLARSFNGMAQSIQQTVGSLEEALAAKQRLLDNLSHEIRTPVAAIKGYAEYAREAELSGEETFLALQRIDAQATRLARIAGRMLELTGLPHETLAPQPVPVQGLFSNVRDTLAPAARRAGVKLVPHPVPQGLTAWGDEALLESLLQNLVENGIKACGEGGGVEIRAEEASDGSCVLVVRDSGRGMSAEELRHMGEAFWRADKARTRAEGGAGLGVALCYSIAALHGGTLVYTSQPGEGTEVRLTLPPAESGVPV